MADGQLYFEEVEVGMALPPLQKTPSNTLLFLYSAITWNPQRIHFDKDYTLTEGYKDVIVHGPLRGAFLSQLLTRWIGDAGVLKKLSYANRDIAYVNEPLACKGTVTRKWIEDHTGWVECEIWVENSQGEKLTPGSATVILPRKGS
ncbi:MAG: acyl dehydratase [Deltaproteobacteria bacterium]|nr:acyl dehydratase [Deltaproteobacteria bacterium]